MTKLLLIHLLYLSCIILHQYRSLYFQCICQFTLFHTERFRQQSKFLYLFIMGKFLLKRIYTHAEQFLDFRFPANIQEQSKQKHIFSGLQ